MPKLHQDRLSAAMAERRKKAYDMRISGMSYPAIADQLGASAETIRKDIRRYMDYLPRENAVELRDMELDKLNRMELGLQSKALKGNTQAISAMVKLMQHRATLMGLDRIESSDGVDAAKEMMGAITKALLEGPTATPVDAEDSDD